MKLPGLKRTKYKKIFLLPAAFFSLSVFSCNISDSKKIARGTSFKPKTGIIKEISASSELDSEGGKYSPKNIANASWKSWVEGSRGDGSGESISITLEEAVALEYICIKSGFGNLAYYWANNRPKDIKIILDDDEERARKFTLLDDPSAQYVTLNDYDRLYSKIKIVIESVYKGTDPADDCAIDEIAVNAGISRRQFYGADYNSEEIPYLYSPEVQKMLRALYILDVGEENVRLSKEGFVEVVASDWETGEKYLDRPSGAFSGELYKGFFPGTGGGHSYNKFQIFLNPNGSHYLFIWHEKTSGTFNLYPSNQKIYVWKNQNWLQQTDLNHSPSLNEIFSALSFIEKRDLSYEFYTKGDSSAEITVYPNDGSLCLPVPLEFEYDQEKGSFRPYKKTAVTELSFGTVESLKSLGDWKSIYRENNDANSLKTFCKSIQIFCYPACFNPDPKMIKFLSESGLKVENEQNDKGDGDLPYNNFSVLESWQAGGNNAGVREALVEAGASYSPKMLESAFEAGNLSALSELIPLVKKEERNVLLSLMGDYYRTETAYKKRTIQKTVDYIKNVLVLMQKNGSDISGTFWHDGTEKNMTLIDGAFLMMDNGFHDYVSPIPLLDLYQSYGLKIPEQIATWNFHGDYTTPVTEVARFWCKCVILDERNLEQEEKSKRIRQRKELEALLDYLLKHGVSINARSPDGDSAIHEFCYKTDKTDFETIRFLVEKGADVNIKNERGETPLAMLLSDREGSDGTQAAIEFLKAHGAKSE